MSIATSKLFSKIILLPIFRIKKDTLTSWLKCPYLLAINYFGSMSNNVGDNLNQ